MGTKIKIEFDEMNVQESVTYILSTEYGLKPNVLKAEIKEDSSGIMILTLEGDQSKMYEAVEGLKKKGFIVSGLERHILRDKARCFSCGACLSLCPTKSFAFDPETW
jgi:NAD-dependent dihydropyrimidine dehydrogenase PreA subunit